MDFLYKYTTDQEIELQDCHQKRALEFFHTVAGHISDPGESSQHKKSEKMAQEKSKTIETEEP